MKRVVLVGALVGAFAIASSSAGAQTPAAGQGTRRGTTTKAGVSQAEGHAAPKTQPDTAPAPSAPGGAMQLGTVRLPKSVKADGKPLAAGSYQVRLTAQTATGDAKGATEGLERWVEFVQGGQVKGREVVTIVPQAEVDKVQKDAPPHANASKVETLKGGDFLRVWINKGGNYYLIHLPPAA